MATLVTTNVIGAILLPDGAIPQESYVSFQIDGHDTDVITDVTIPPSVRTFFLDADGDLDANLWPNDRGIRVTLYSVIIGISDGRCITEYAVGKMQVPEIGPVDLNDLLPLSPPSGISLDQYLAALESSVAAAEAAAAAAAASATLLDGYVVVKEYATVADLLADTTGYSFFTGGDYVHVIEGDFWYLVTLTGAGHIENSAGTAVGFNVLAGADGYKNVKAWGVVGGGVTDDTALLITALSSGYKNIRIPEGTYLVTTVLLDNLSELNVNAWGAIFTISTEQVSGILRVTNSTNVVFRGIAVKGTGNVVVSASGYHNHGVQVIDCDGFELLSSAVYDMSSGGFLALDSINVKVKDNIFRDNLDQWDIACGYAGTDFSMEDIVVTGNICSSDNRYGVHFQGIGKRVKISDNLIRSKTGYGIMVYRFVLTGSKVWEDITISNNIINDISHDTTQGYFSGMGIYCQGTRRIAITGNILTDILKARTDTVSPNRTLPPGAISVNSTTQVSCIGNTVNGSGIDGIDLVQIENAREGSVVSGNVCTDIEWSGIYVQGVDNAAISGNSLHGTLSNRGGAISILGHTTKRTAQLAISGNTSSGGFSNTLLVAKSTGTDIRSLSITGNQGANASNSAYSISDVVGLAISGNTELLENAAGTSGIYAFSVSACADFSINGNAFRADSGTKFDRGFRVVNSTNGVVSGNTVTGIADIFYSMYEAGNTDVFFYQNKNDRQSMPMVGSHLVGNDLGVDTAITREYGTVAPVSGYHGIGSILWNISPITGGFVGWICVTAGTPGTWKTFGVIS